MQINSKDGISKVIEMSKQLPVNQRGELNERKDSKGNANLKNPDTTAAISEGSVIEAIEKANKIIINHNTRAQFSVHEKTKAIMVKIIDTDNNKVLREFPPEKILDLVAKLWDLAGIMVDERR